MGPVHDTVETTVAPQNVEVLVVAVDEDLLGEQRTGGSLARRGTALTLTLNGSPAGSLDVPDGKLTFALRPGGAAVSFANLVVK